MVAVTPDVFIRYRLPPRYTVVGTVSSVGISSQRIPASHAFISLARITIGLCTSSFPPAKIRVRSLSIHRNVHKFA